MLMPVPQTLAKKLNKDVFRGGAKERERERGNVHTERCWAQISDALQARDVARTGVCEERGGGPSSSLTNPNQRLQLLLWGREQGGEGRG